MNLLKPSVLQAMAFVLFLLALPLLSFGTLQDQQLLWYTGLAMVVVAGVLPPLARFVGPDETADESADETADQADDAYDDDKAEHDVDQSGPDNRREPSAGPIGPPGASPGREPRRARVEEQRELARREHDEEEKS